MHKSTGDQLDLGIAGPTRSADTITALTCDKWVASSALQKSIRRGDVVTAQRAALTLWNADPRSVWRRLIIIAMEDVGVGSADAVIETTRLASDPKLRGRQGGEVAAIIHVCQRLAESAKDRCSDFLISAAAHDLGLETARGACGSIPVSRRLEFVANQTRPLPERAVAAWYASGIENGRERRVGSGDFDGLMKVYADLGAHGPLPMPSVSRHARRGSRSRSSCRFSGSPSQMRRRRSTMVPCRNRPTSMTCRSIPSTGTAALAGRRSPRSDATTPRLPDS